MKTTFLSLLFITVFALVTACSKPATSTNTASTNTASSNSSASKSTSDSSAKPTETASKQGGDDNVFTNKEAGVTFTVPAGWKAEPSGDQIQVSSPDGAVTIILWVPDTDNFQEAAKALGDQIDKQLENVQTDGDGDTVTVNGMEAFELKGTGTYEGTKVHWAVDLIKANKPFIALSIGESEKLQQHMDGYRALVQSIKKV